MVGLVALAGALVVVGCGDDTEGATGGGGGAGGAGTGGETTSDGGGGGGSPVTAESYAAGLCAGLPQQASVAIDGRAEPPAAIELDTLYDVSLEVVNGEGPLQYTGGATLTVTEPGQYLVLAVDLSGDTQMSLVAIAGDDIPDPAECTACITECDSIDSAFVYELPAGTHSVGLTDPAKESLSMIVTRID